jgi:magnesium-protoporphyrin O-methyltransferase
MADAMVGPATASATYRARRAWLHEYFDRTAAATWAQLTSTAPVGRVRQTVREGRDGMRRLLLAWLPTNLEGRRVLDAGCGTGALAVELARRGAAVVAVDLSLTLTDLARQRLAESQLRGRVEFRAGDMLDPAHGTFDHVVAMDSLIHYDADDMVAAYVALASRTRRSVVATFAPRTPLLGAMHAVGRLFPRGQRAPAIQPVGADVLTAALAAHPALGAWTVGRTARVQRGFYTSQGLELTRGGGGDR